MKVLPTELGGIEIVPETQWEESYLSALDNELHSPDFYRIQKTDFLDSFVLLNQNKREIIY